MRRARLRKGVDAVRQPTDLAAFIQANMPIAPAPGLPEIRLHGAHAASGLWRLAGRAQPGSDAPPYWAYPWPGGVALGRYFFDRPETVRGRSVIDLGAGSGLVGLAAAKCGAGKIIAAETDRAAIIALGLNAAANGVAIETIARDILDEPPPKIDLVAVGDLFYERDLGSRVTAFLNRCLDADVDILIGDLGRAYLPLARLCVLAEYPVRDFGDGVNVALKTGRVFSFEPARA